MPISRTPLRRLAKQSAEVTRTDAKAAKMTLLIGTGEILRKAVESGTEKLEDFAEDGVVTMPGCPNPGYSINVNVNIVTRVVVPIGVLSNPPPVETPNQPTIIGPPIIDYPYPID
jgi:hypothetical protein